MAAAEVLIDHALGSTWDGLPDAARGMAATFLHDSIAVGVAGSVVAMSETVRSGAGNWGASTESAHILGLGMRQLPAATAALINAFHIHCQEFDAVHEMAVVHPMATIVAALLAEAGRGPPVSGRDMLVAINAGVDVAVGLGLAAQTPLRFFRPATAGIFGSVAAIASLRRMPRKTALDAFGLALAFASGTMQAHVEGLPVLPLQIAAAARGAVEAVDLARAGMPGPRGAIDGPFGYAALFEERTDLPAMLAALPGHRRILGVSWKPFPTGRAAHGGIVATQRLMAEHGLFADTLDQLRYRAPPLVYRLVGRRPLGDMAPAYARLCLPYLAAVTLLRGTVGLGDFDQAALHDPAVLALAERIVIEADDNPDPAAFTPAVAQARWRDGSVASVTIYAQLGSPADPLTRAQHLDKAAACLGFAGFHSAAASLENLIGRFDSVADVIAGLNAALRPPAGLNAALRPPIH